MVTGGSGPTECAGHPKGMQTRSMLVLRGHPCSSQFIFLVREKVFLVVTEEAAFRVQEELTASGELPLFPWSLALRADDFVTL
jgi:hypothetical protein